MTIYPKVLINCQIIIIYQNDDFHYNLFLKTFNIFLLFEFI
jgi:hypothetical protein